jgi:membrane protein insertase Oxa1/YidC/SpoIIIJ
MDWWATIAVGTIGLRTFFSLPIALIVQKRRQRLETLVPILRGWQETLTRNPIQSFKDKRTELYKKNNCRPLTTVLISLSQVPVFITTSLYLRDMAMKNIGGLDSGGILWFDNLTICDPTLISGTMLALVYYTNSELIPKRKNLFTLDDFSGKIHSAFLKVASVVSLIFATQIPMVVTIYWFTSALYSLIQYIFIHHSQNLIAASSSIHIVK